MFDSDLLTLREVEILRLSGSVAREPLTSALELYQSVPGAVMELLQTICELRSGSRAGETHEQGAAALHPPAAAPESRKS